MPLETATYINQLDAANPLGSDPIASGDDHLRLIKAALKATFPNITGVVNATHTQLSNAANAVLKDGSVAMTGALTLPGNPSSALQAAPKQYVDAADATLTASVATKANSATTITGTGAITGGGDLSANRTLDLANTGVTAGVYGSTTKIARVTVNAKGQVTAIQEVDPAVGLGYNQTWQDVTASRSNNTDYTNGTGVPITVMVNKGGSGPSNSLVAIVGGVTLPQFNSDTTNGGTNSVYTFIVPPGATYRVSSSTGIGKWCELR